jgi:hypothetical protein
MNKPISFWAYPTKTTNHESRANDWNLEIRNGPLQLHLQEHVGFGIIFFNYSPRLGLWVTLRPKKYKSETVKSWAYVNPSNTQQADDYLAAPEMKDPLYCSTYVWILKSEPEFYKWSTYTSRYLLFK